MADVISNISNLNATFGANYIGNASATGSALTFGSGATEGTAVTFARAPVGSPTTGALIGLALGSTPSAAVFQLVGQADVSLVSIAFTGANEAGAAGIRVLRSDGTTFGWIPIMPSAAVVAAVRG
jgi:hypothetical protein